MKPKTKEELQEIANQVYFNKNAGIDYIYAIEDGNFFYPGAENYAIAHANNREVFVLERQGRVTGNDQDFQNKNQIHRLGAKALIKKIRETTSLEELQELDTVEKVSSDDRQTVNSTYHKKLASFEKQAASLPSEKALISLINAVQSEEELDALELKHNLSNHSDKQIVEAFTAKEDEFLG